MKPQEVTDKADLLETMIGNRPLLWEKRLE
jgi:hypothetical protein